jgi:hypothetical protein
MARLRIMQGANLDVDGYVNVVNNLVAKPGKYRKYQKRPNQRPTMLQDAASNGAAGTHLIKQMVLNDPTGVGEEPITEDNCYIVGDRDQVRDASDADGASSRVTVPMPPEPMDAADAFDYLDKYAQKISDLWATDRPKCRKFMFGVMLLTRCR